jgi:hypothetical protein
LIDTGLERRYALGVLGLECGNLGSKGVDVVSGLNGDRGDQGGNSHRPDDAGNVSHCRILVE